MIFRGILIFFLEVIDLIEKEIIIVYVTTVNIKWNNNDLYIKTSLRKILMT
jgi:hypothetical protein